MSKQFLTFTVYVHLQYTYIVYYTICIHKLMCVVQFLHRRNIVFLQVEFAFICINTDWKYEQAEQMIISAIAA